MMRYSIAFSAVILIGVGWWSAHTEAGGWNDAPAPQGAAPAWESANPLVPLTHPPLGINHAWSEFKDPPTPERVRLGRWLFFDKRLSADGTIACATCHRPEFAFAEPVAISHGIRGQQLDFAQPDGRRVTRKTPTIINQPWSLTTNLFWDGRMSSLDDMSIMPVSNPQAMGSTHEAMVKTLADEGYASYFAEAFGTSDITKERVGKALADYQRTRLSGNSAWDRWRRGDQAAVSNEVKQGHELFFGKARCSQCHLGHSFTDTLFHNLGVGWNSETTAFNDTGRFNVTKVDRDRGAFKTPPLREVALRTPFMHDGSIPTLIEVVRLYNRGGSKNPYLDPRISPLNLDEKEIRALVAFMEALSSGRPLDTPPAAFPQRRPASN
jgi:cytochrome c peroxidase